MQPDTDAEALLLGSSPPNQIQSFPPSVPRLKALISRAVAHIQSLLVGLVCQLISEPVDRVRGGQKTNTVCENARVLTRYAVGFLRPKLCVHEKTYPLGRTSLGVAGIKCIKLGFLKKMSKEAQEVTPSSCTCRLSDCWVMLSASVSVIQIKLCCDL